MSEIMKMSRQERLLHASDLADNLPVPDYAVNYQVEYNRTELIEAMAENLSTQGVAKTQEIDALRTELAEVGSGASDRPVVITNSCAEEIKLDQPIDQISKKTLEELRVIDASNLVNPIAIQRICGQFFKPRSSMTEVINGQEVFSYMGDGINTKVSPRPEYRTPDVTRLVAGALQSRDLQAALTYRKGSHVLTAHEALSLPYELPFKRIGPNGNKYLQSAHLPWIGMRTNQLAGVHLELLSGIENPVGIKIGANSNEKHIAGIAKTLNPDDLPGKLVFMVRIGQKDAVRLNPVLKAIKSHAPKSVIMYDIHGVTKTREDGKKVRLVGDILHSIMDLSQECSTVDLRLNGLHLETTNIRKRLECIDHPDQRPMDGSVDPRLNPRQTKYILDNAAPFLNQ